MNEESVPKQAGSGEDVKGSESNAVSSLYTKAAQHPFITTGVVAAAAGLAYAAVRVITAR